MGDGAEARAGKALRLDTAPKPARHSEPVERDDDLCFAITNALQITLYETHTLSEV